jgi:hypothetical protein
MERIPAQQPTRDPITMMMTTPAMRPAAELEPFDTGLATDIDS